MSRAIDFYLFNESADDPCYRAIFRMLEKYYKFGQIIYILVDSLSVARMVDDLLWTFHDVGFLPHEIITNNLKMAAPIRIGYDSDLEMAGDLLINLSTSFPRCYTNFQAIWEIILNDEAIKSSGRQRYKSYKEAGASVKMFNMNCE